MFVKDILSKLNKEQDGYELRITCYEKQYTKENPLVSDSGYLYQDSGVVCFDIDWDKKAKTLVSELKEYEKEKEIVHWDEDCRVHNFEEVFIDNINKLVILI